MACESCGSGGCSSGSCGSGSCGGGKFDVFDWLSNMQLPAGQEPFNCVEVRFKNDRKEYFRNNNHLSLYVGDTIAVEARSGHDVGVVTLTGELVRIQMNKKRVKDDEVLNIYRKANQRDIETWKAAREKEVEVRMKARIIASDLGLDMKISDVEFQGDGTKATFYYTAEGRVDFRELIKRYAATFGIRIEMRQIGFRQEAAKIGGIGSCGRELCCSTWLTDFRTVSTSAARYQQLAINPQKLAGQCGKLKCCLNYELDSYLDALEEFPDMESTFETDKGTAVCVKIDVFKKEMWYTYRNESAAWYKLSLAHVKDYISTSENGEKNAPLEELAKELQEEIKKDYTDIIQENSLERFERKNRRKKRRNKPKEQVKGTTKQTTARKPENKNRKPNHKNGFTGNKKKRRDNNSNGKKDNP